MYYYVSILGWTKVQSTRQPFSTAIFEDLDKVVMGRPVSTLTGSIKVSRGKIKEHPGKKD